MVYSDEIQRERLRILYEQSPNRPALHFISGALIFGIAISKTPMWLLLSWFLLLSAINTIRIYELVEFHKQKIINSENEKILWGRFRVYVALTGMMYGVGAYAFSFYLTKESYLLVMLVISACMPAAMVSFLSDKKSFVFFISFSLLPLFVQQIALMQLHGFIFSVCIIIYFMVLMRLFNWQYNVLIDTISLKISHYKLLQRVEKSNAELEKLSSIDALTGVCNRRAFDKKLEDELRRSIRTQSFLSIIMLDIDKFKEFNDEYGHLARDECLAKIATLLNQRVIRTGDFIARFGGEEFVIILPVTDKEGAVSFALDLQEYVHSLSIPQAPNVQSDFVTISMGVATLSPKEEIGIKEFINYADKALYYSKALGRNAVSHFDDISKLV